jgi:hypothetical protein
MKNPAFLGLVAAALILLAVSPVTYGITKWHCYWFPLAGVCQ